MIELIFVIVIIGILASVAIPRLAATKDDAINVRDCKNISICVSDISSEYTAKETATKSTSDACKSAEASKLNSILFTISSGKVTVTGAPAVCQYLNRTYIFGGSRISI